MNKHYIEVDVNNNVIKAFSDAFEQPTVNSILVNENGDRHFHLNLYTIVSGVPILRYKYVAPNIVERHLNGDSTSEEKYSLLRKHRDDILKQTIIFQERHFGEERGIADLVGKQQLTLTQAQFHEWLLYWEALRDLPQTANLTTVELKDIHPGNTTLFPAMPAIILGE